MHVFVWDRGEVQLLRDCLQRHLGDPGTQPGIAGIARLLFPGGDPGGTPPGTVVLDVVSELFALPVPYAWDLAAVSAEREKTKANWVDVKSEAGLRCLHTAVSTGGKGSRMSKIRWPAFWSVAWMVSELPSMRMPPGLSA